MTEAWELAIRAYSARLAAGEGVGEPTDIYRLSVIEDRRETKYTEADLQKAVLALDQFCASEEGQTAGLLLTASEQDILLDMFTDGDLTFVYIWNGNGFDVTWYPECLQTGANPIVGACPQSGTEMDTVSTREVVNLLTMERPSVGLRPEEIVPRLRKALDEIATAAPEVMRGSPAKRTLRLVKS